jgi:hypothetical protein
LTTLCPEETSLVDAAELSQWAESLNNPSKLHFQIFGWCKQKPAISSGCGVIFFTLILVVTTGIVVFTKKPKKTTMHCSVWGLLYLAQQIVSPVGFSNTLKSTLDSSTLIPLTSHEKH